MRVKVWVMYSLWTILVLAHYIFGYAFYAHLYPVLLKFCSISEQFNFPISFKFSFLFFLANIRYSWYYIFGWPLGGLIASGLTCLYPGYLPLLPFFIILILLTSLHSIVSISPAFHFLDITWI
jgi:hypothetical protein